ncbi:Hpt domain-containing protein [Pseudoroseomonas wenyumeiae]
MSDLRRELLAAFDAEHKEHLGAIRAALDAAERGEQADLRDIFRRAHSLKGAARAVDLPVVEEVAHRLEAVLARVAEGAMALDARVAAGVQVGLDGIEGYVAALASDPAAPAPVAAMAALDALLGMRRRQPHRKPPPLPCPQRHRPRRPPPCRPLPPRPRPWPRRRPPPPPARWNTCG